MTDDELKELEALYAKVERYELALKHILEAPKKVRVNPYKRLTVGMYEGLAAASRVAGKALEMKDGREEQKEI